MRRLGLGVGLLLLCALIGVGIYASKQAIPYQKVVQHGPSPEALANPYLAAEYFLRQQGLNVTHANSLEAVLAQLPPHGNSLLLPGKRNNMTPRQTDQLLEWANSGGHLLVVTDSLWDEETQKSGDLLLDRLQLQPFYEEDDEQEDPAQEPSKKAPPPNLTKLYSAEESGPAYFGFDPRPHLKDPRHLAQFTANSANATHLMQLNHGQGRITVVTDAELWRQNNIGDHDNAWLLWYLTRGTDVTLLFSTDHDNLLSLLIRHFPQALLAFAALLGLWVWQQAMRQGPLQHTAPTARRQLQEHLRASADFLLRRSGQGSLLRALQTDILRRARRRHQGFEQLDSQQQWHVLERLTRQPLCVISQALAPVSEKRLSSADFTQRVTTLQTLRNAL